MLLRSRPEELIHPTTVTVKYSFHYAKLLPNDDVFYDDDSFIDHNNNDAACEAHDWCETEESHTLNDINLHIQNGKLWVKWPNRNR